MPRRTPLTASGTLRTRKTPPNTSTAPEDALSVAGGSLAEAILLNRLEHAGLPTPERQFRFCPTRKWRADFAFVAARLLVEVDGGSWIGGRHTTGSGFEADCEKQSTAAALGWRVIRVTPRMVDDGRAVTLIRRALEDA